MSNNDVGRLMAVKAALVVTTNTPGWRYVKQIADNVVKAAVEAAISEDDDTKAVPLRRKAKVAREIFNDLFNAIDTSKQFGTNDEPEWFANLQFDLEPQEAIQN